MRNILESILIEFRQVYPFVFTWSDEGDVEYDRHYHRGDVSMYVLEGEIYFTFENGKKRRLRKGDRFDIPKDIFHTALVGKNGCKYIIGQEFEEDEWTD